jgi:hypothetical protein
MRDNLDESCNVLIRTIDLITGETLHERLGHNVWTNTGREYSAGVKTYQENRTPLRNDRICYVGLGSGTQPETVNVQRLVTPIQFSAGKFLNEINHARTSFQSVSGVRTAVRYSCIFERQHINIGGENTVLISECGLFTDGDLLTFAVGGRSTMIGESLSQSPIAYHSFDPIPKTPNVQLDIIWELRH